MANTKITNHIVDKTFITGQTAVTAADGDYLLVSDASDSGALKKVLASDLIQTSEEVQDLIGAMFSSNTETGIAATYQDGDGTIDLVIGDDTIVSSMLDTNIAIAGTLGVTGNITGTLATAAQTNITSLGTLTALTGGTGDLIWDTNTLFVDSSANKIYIGDTASHTDDFLQIESPASGGGHGIQIRRNDSNGDQGIGRVMFGNNNDTDLATIQATTDGQADSARLAFFTQPTSGSSTERMRINSSGNVGIGTTNCVSRLSLGNPSADGTIDYTKGITFVDTLSSTSNAWVHAAIVTTGSTGFDGNLIFATDGDGNQDNDTSGLTERMRIKSNGYVGINGPSSQGATDPTLNFEAWDGDGVTKLGIGNNAAYVQRYQTHATAPASLVIDKARGTQASPSIVSPGDDLGRIIFRGYTNGLYEAASIQCEVNSNNLVNNGADIPSDIYFKTTQDGGGGPLERMRIDYKGTVGIGINAPTAAGLHLSMGNPNSAGDAHLLVSKTGNNDWTAKFGPGSDDYGLLIRQVGDYMLAIQHHGDGNYEFRVDSNGAIYATDTSVNSISDRRLKENIVDAKSQWDDIKALKWRNFNWNEASGRSRDNTLLGLIADEVESVSPKLIGIDAQPKEDKDAGVTDPEYKNVKYSIVWMKAMKALQEAMERIETLEAEVAALKG